MKCAEVCGLIYEYLEERIEGQARLDLSTHIEECPQCAREFEAARQMLASLRDLSHQRCPVDCWPAVLEGVLIEERDRMPAWRWIVRPVVAAPGLAIVAAIAVVLAWPFGKAPRMSDGDFVPEYKYYIGAHSHLQRQQAFSDPDVVFVAAELQKASLVSDGGQ